MKENLSALIDLSGQRIDRVNDRTQMSRVVLDINSSESLTNGKHEGLTFNWHFSKTCGHPLFLFNGVGDMERAILRPGYIHNAYDWRLVLEPVVQRHKERGVTEVAITERLFAMILRRIRRWRHAPA
uniref:Transposase DDE domain-containing protein n=1 Tax=Magnetococcus massalia (strain MO-1) TaxID=451514 RepID=A0A1S7LI80_MAGMO|nr:Protein of unknown function [Candidatus Magnetococcus massalia]